jgi:hypothetical protein
MKFGSVFLLLALLAALFICLRAADITSAHRADVSHLCHLR